MSQIISRQEALAMAIIGGVVAVSLYSAWLHYEHLNVVAAASQYEKLRTTIPSDPAKAAEHILLLANARAEFQAKLRSNIRYAAILSTVAVFYFCYLRRYKKRSGEDDGQEKQRGASR